MKQKVSIKPIVIAIWAFCMVAVIVATAMAFEKTSTTAFCTSCHEMERYQDELKLSSHAVDEDKKPIECSQCHFPEPGPDYVALKVYLGLKDLAVHYFGDPDNLSRRELQVSARRFVPDSSCLACHKDLKKGADGKKELSREGQLSHDAYLGVNGQTEKGCADCHHNMAHLPVFDRRYDHNAEFTARMIAHEEGL